MSISCRIVLSITGKTVGSSNTRTITAVTEGRGPMGPHDHDDLIATVRTVNSHNQLILGPQAMPDRVAQALVRFSRHDCHPHTSEIGQSIPGELLHNVSQHVKALTEMLVDEYIAVGNEEGQSGLFAGVLNSGKVFQFGEWEATIRAQVFSPEKKEPKVGADIGIIVDVRRGNDRVVKGSLIQAKREAGWQGDVNKLPRFVGQAKKMQETTHESYGMIFSPDDSYIFSPQNPQSTFRSIGSLRISCVAGEATAIQRRSHKPTISRS